MPLPRLKSKKFKSHTLSQSKSPNLPPSWKKSTSRNHKKNSIGPPTHTIRSLINPIDVARVNLNISSRYRYNEEKNKYLSRLENLTKHSENKIKEANIIRSELRELGVLKTPSDNYFSEMNNIKTFRIPPSFDEIIQNPQKYKDIINSLYFEKLTHNIPQHYRPRPYNSFNSKKEDTTHNSRVREAIEELKQKGNYNPRYSLKDTQKLISNIMSRQKTLKQRSQLTKRVHPSNYVEFSANNIQPKEFVTGNSYTEPLTLYRGRGKAPYTTVSAAAAGGGKYYKSKINNLK